MWVDVGAMDRGVAAGGPAGAALEEVRVRDFANHEFAGLDIRPLHLHMAFQAEIIVALDKKLAIDRAVGIVAGGASVAESFVFENEWAALLAMALGTVLVQPRHGESAGGLHDVMAVGVVALDAVHHPFDDGMMLRQLEFGVDVQVALKAGGGILAGIDDEAAAAATDAHMFAGGAVARFAAADGGELDVVLAEAAMGAGGK